MNSPIVGMGLRRAGTSLIYRLLRRSPFLRVSPVKEWPYWDDIDLFSPESKLSDLPFGVVRGLDSTGSARNWQKKFIKFNEAFQHPQRFGIVDSLDLWLYLNFLWDVGDFTPRNSYLSERQLDEISARAPGLKTVICIRNPITRIWSNFLNHQRKLQQPAGAEQLATFLTNPSLNPDAVGIVKTLRRNFGEDRVLVIFFDDIIEKPLRVCWELSKFVGKPILLDRSASGLQFKERKSTGDKTDKVLNGMLADYYADSAAELESEFGRRLHA